MITSTKLPPHAKKVHSATLQSHDETAYLNPAEGTEYWLINECHGEYDIDWIVVIKEGKEIGRHQARFAISIAWAN